MPIDGAEIHAQTHLGHRRAAPDLGGRSAQGDQTAQQMQPVQRGDQVEEGIGRVGRQEVAAVVSCCHTRSWPARNKADARRPTINVQVAPARGHVCPMQRDLLMTRTPVFTHNSLGTGSAASPQAHAHEYVLMTSGNMADDGEKHAQSDFAAGRDECARRENRPTPPPARTWPSAVAGRATTRDGRDSSHEQDDGAHGWDLRPPRPAVHSEGRNPRRRRARCSRRPSDKPSGAPCPSCHASAGCPEFAIPASRLARDCRRPLSVEQTPDQVEQEHHLGAPTIKAATVMNAFRSWADAGMKAVWPISW